MLEAAHLRLAQAHFVAKALRVSDRILQVVLRIRVFIYTDRDYVSRARAPETVGAHQRQLRVFALDVILVEGVSRQPVWSGGDGNLFLETDRRFSLQCVTVPDLDQRAVAKQTHVTRAGSLVVLLIRRCVGYIDSDPDFASSDDGRRRATCRANKRSSSDGCPGSK